MDSRDLTFAWEGIELAGTLHLPDAIGSHPVAIMLQGSGPSDRDSDGYFVEIRERLIVEGVATFAFDKPGCGVSTGDWRDYALGDRARQAEAARELVKGQEGVDAARVGFWGHSQGGWMVQQLASRHHDLPFAVASSGPSIGVVQQDLFALEHMMKAAGFSQSHVEAALNVMRQAVELAETGSPFEEMDEKLSGQAAGEPWEDYMKVEDPREWGLFLKFVDEGYDPLVALRSIRCPFLAVYGARDVLVPAWQSARETGECLVESGARDATVVVFPKGNHRIQDDETGGFVEGYLDLLGSWLGRHASARDT
jgi:pimeloyl-ACP methyl ester carboxylesterase